MINYKELKEKIYGYKTKYPEGFTDTEIEALLNDIGKQKPINLEKFNDALNCITVMEREGETITYACDVMTAFLCGLENRNPHHWEWD